MAVHRSFVDRQLLQRRVQMVAQRPLQLCQLPACRELPVQRVAVARLITDDSMFLVLRQPIIPHGELHAFIRVQFREPALLVTGLVFPDGRTHLRELIPDIGRQVIRNDHGFRFGKPHSPLRLCLEVARRKFSRRSEHLADLAGGAFADGIPLLRERPSDGCFCLLTLRGLHHHVADDLHLIELVVRVCLVLAHDRPCGLLDALFYCVHVGLVLLRVHLAEPAARGLHRVDALEVLRADRLHGLRRRAERLPAALCLHLGHSAHDVLQRVLPVQFRKAPPVAAPVEAIQSIVNARLTQHALKPRQQPCLYVLDARCFMELVAGRPPVDLARRRALILIVFPCTYDEVIHSVCVDIILHEVVDPLLLQLRFPVEESAVLLFVAVADDLAHRVLDLLHRLIVARFHARLDVRQLLRADLLNQFRQRVVTEGVEFLLLHDRFQSFPLIGQIGRADAVVPCELVRQLRRTHAALFVNTCALQCAVVAEHAARDLLAQPREPLFHGAHLVVVHWIFHRRGRRRIRVAAVDLVPAVRLRVDALASEHDGDRPIHAVPLRGLDDRDARHRQPTQIERIPQVLFRQVVDGHEIPRLFHGIPQREFFLYSPLILRASFRNASAGSFR